MRIGLLSVICLLTVIGGSTSLAQWHHWGGPQRNFHSPSTGLADSWPEAGPPILWSRALGVGHSTVVVDDNRLFTMYRVGSAGRTGPWAAEEFVIAMDAASGKTLWEYKYPSQPLNFSYGAGPHSTPTVVGDRVFATGTNKQIHAFNKRTGEVLWSVDLVKQYGATPAIVRAPVKAGYACSLLAYNDTVICQVGGRGQAVMAFRQSDGSVVWKSGDFLVSESSPILINVEGEEQVVIFAGQAVHGLSPATGEILWSHPHDTDSDMNNSTPIWGADNTLIVSSAYNQGTRAIRLNRKDGKTQVEPLWFSNRLRLMFANALRLGDHLYGSNGDFGPSFITAVNVKTGETVWQERGFGRSSFLAADGKAIIIDEDGDLVLAKLSPEKMTVLAQAHIFNTVSWTAPTLVGTTLYARDREKIVALDLGKR